MPRLLSALVALVVLAAGCAGPPAVVCGPFRSAAATGCFPAFDYRSVVQIDSGRERDGVYRTRNSGSGILLDASGLLVTASHVVNGRDRVAVRTGDAVYTATLLPGLDFPEADVAYLRITGAARAVPGGCVLSNTLPPCRFPVAAMAAEAPLRPVFGAEVQVLGYPSWKARLLRGRLVDPTPKLLRLAAEHGLGKSPASTALPGVEPVSPASAASTAIRDDAQAFALVERRIRDGYLFAELDTPGRNPGISGGAVVRDGEVIGMVVESWNSFEKAVLICAPLPSQDREITRTASRASPRPSPLP